MGKLEGRVALVTGAARGQGRAEAEALAREGADIVLVDSLGGIDWLHYDLPTQADLDETSKIVHAHGRRVISRKADVRSRSEMSAVVVDTLKEFGHIDIVVANAGISSSGKSFWEIPEQQWDDVLAVNLTGVLHTVSAAIPSMLEQTSGSVVIVASSAGLAAPPHLAEYNSSKHGVIGLGRTMANELAPYDIRVNMVCPGTVATDMALNQRTYQLFCPDIPNPTADDVRDRFTSRNALPHPYAEASDIGATVLFLASDDARFITGIALPVDLGILNKWH